MLVRDARAAAIDWSKQEAESLPGFYGAYLAGSISSMPLDSALPEASDVDIKVVLEDPPAASGPEKFVYRGVIFDVSHCSREDVSSPEAVLGNYFTAVHFAYPSVLSDPTGRLTEIQAVVAREYSRRAWVLKRCEHARAFLNGVLDAPPFPHYDALQMLLLATNFAPHMVLVAGLRNPTHRRGVATCRQVLDQYGLPELHERLLAIVGSADMTRTAVELLLANCAEAFEVARDVRKTPVLMASNISDFARSVVIGGGQELIDQGFHREAVVWIAFMHALCRTLIQNDASQDVKTRFEPDYARLLEAIGFSTQEDVATRKESLRQLVPHLWHAVETILNTNPDIRD